MKKLSLILLLSTIYVGTSLPLEPSLQKIDFANFETKLANVKATIKPNKKDLPKATSDELFRKLDTSFNFAKRSAATLLALDNVQENIDTLKTIRDTAQVRLADTISIAEQVYSRKDLDALPKPSSWTDKIKTQEMQHIFPTYKEFIRDYKATKSNYARFKKSYGKNYNLIEGDAASFYLLLNRIEGCLENLSYTDFNDKKALKAFAEEIHKQFPALISDLDQAKIDAAPSKQRAALSIYADITEGVLEAIINATNKLLTKVAQ